jgi:hypothetical protein
MTRLLFLLFLLPVISSSAQDTLSMKEKKSPDKINILISVNAGESIPVGIFSRDLTFTLPGYNYYFESAVFLNSNMGFGGRIGGIHNPSDQGRNGSQINFAKGDPTAFYRLNNDNWKNTYLFLGPYFSYPGKILNIDFKPGIGYINSGYPELNVSSASGMVKYKGASEKVRTLAYNISLSMRARLVDQLYLIFDTGLIYSRPEYSYVVKNGSNSFNATFHQDLTAVNLSWGLCFYTDPKSIQKAFE